MFCSVQLVCRGVFEPIVCKVVCKKCAKKYRLLAVRFFISSD
nr:MAG TPA: hypothetical protein [Caudoviricetes sp.]